MKRIAFLALFLFLLFNNMSSMTSQAQCRRDTDGDGVCDTVDRCPNEAGPGSRGGCPEPDSDGDGVTDPNDECPNQAGVSSNRGCPAPDRDGDGTPDDQDRCPDTSGLAPNGGCPEGEDGTTPTDPCVSITASPDCNPNNNDNNGGGSRPDLPNRGYCHLSTRFDDRVNIRIRPSTRADIVGQLDASETFPVLETLDTAEGRWYHIPDGWVFGDVIQLGGRCRDRVPADTSDEPEMTDCPSLVGLSPINDSVSGVTLFSWTSPISEVPVAFYQINIFDENGNPLYDDYTFEPATQINIDLASIAGLGANFKWNVVALDISEYPLCASPMYGNTNDAPDEPIVDCPSFIGLNPINVTVAGQTLFTWTSPISDVPVAFYQINLYDSGGQWVFDTYTFEPTTQVVIDLSQANLGMNPDFQWNVVALDIDEEPLCASPIYTAHTGDIPVTGANPNPMCADFAGVAPLFALGSFTTDFSWTVLADVPYYHLKLYNGEGAMVADAFTINMGALGGFSLITSPEAIGEGENWSWQVDAHWANWNIACSTPLYPISREAATGQTPSQPNPEGLCDAFAILSPEDNLIVSPDMNLVQLTWHNVNQPVLMAYTVFAGPEGGEMLPQFSSPDTVGSLELSQFGEATDIQWMVKAASASALAVLSCESPVYHIHRGESEGSGANRPTRGINFPNIDPDILIDWACPQVQVIIFSDSVQSSYFQWQQIPGAAGYRLNLYDASDVLVDSHDMDGFVAALVMQVPFGPKDEWSFDLQLLSNGGNALCTSQRYHVERDFESTGDITFIPVNLELVECAELAAISPLDVLGSGLFTYFEWTNIDDAVSYDIKIYNSADELAFWGWAGADIGEATETRAFYTDAAHIGAGTDFTWEVIATLESEISCSTGKIPVTRPSNTFGFLPDLDVQVVTLELIECAGFEALGPLSELGEGQISYFIWTNLDDAVEYQVRMYNQNDYLVLWAVEVADHPGDIEGGAYQTDEAGIGGGDTFSWDVTAILSNGVACKSDRIEVKRPSSSPNRPKIDIWDLRLFIPNGDDFVDPDDSGRGDFCNQFPTDQLPAVQFPTDQRGGSFGIHFCHGTGGGGGAGVGDPLAQCGAVDTFVPGDGSVNVLDLVGAVDMFRPSEDGGIYASLNFCNPSGHGLLLPAVKVFFLDAESMGYGEKGTLVLIIAIQPDSEGGSSIIGHAIAFVPEDVELNFANVQKAIEDGFAAPPELTDGTLDGFLIGLLHDADLDPADEFELNFTNLMNVLLGAGGLDPSLVNIIGFEVMH